MARVKRKDQRGLIERALSLSLAHCRARGACASYGAVSSRVDTTVWKRSGGNQPALDARARSSVGL
eukprot:3100574-Pleurochrysis_carterae.AAC.1